MKGSAWHSSALPFCPPAHGCPKTQDTQSQAHPIMSPAPSIVQCEWSLCPGAQAGVCNRALLSQGRGSSTASSTAWSQRAIPLTATRAAQRTQGQRAPRRADRSMQAGKGTYLHPCSTHLHLHRRHHCLGSPGCGSRGPQSRTAAADRPPWAGPP